MKQDEHIRQGVGTRLQEFRKEFGYPKAGEFAGFLGTHANTLSNYENGKRFPSAVFLAQLSNSSRINLNWLLTGEGHMYDDWSIVTSSGDTFMADNNDSDEGKSLRVDQGVLKEAISLATEFERQGGGKLATSKKIEVVWQFYQDLINKD